MSTIDYGNWVPKRIIYGSVIIGVLFLVAAIWLQYLLVIAALVLVATTLFVYARHKFSASGGNIQQSVWNLVLSNLDWDGEGKVLDIGCGNGPLTVMLTKKFPKAQVTGIDYWGKRWEYSKNTCEKNAQAEGVQEQVKFQKADASALPFEDEQFDAAVSNFVFHEVSSAKDKREVIREALRVVKKGGKFAFQDEFLIKKIYGNPDELIATIKSWGITKVEFIKTCDSPFISWALKLPLFLGSMAIIAGEK